MTDVKRAIPLLVAAGLLVGLMAPMNATASAPKRSWGCWQPRHMERGFATETNRARTAAGLGKLHFDPQLSKDARVHTRAMARSNTLYHTSNSQLAHRVTNWVMLGENVGEGYGASVGALQSAFMHSPEHRANILHSTFRHVGIGVVKHAGVTWVTVLFEASSDPGTRLSPPRCANR